jgi:L-threonylcarbamoyladenylate synthase
MNAEVAAVLKNDGIAVIATDTIYGVVGSARSERTIRRLYEIKGRDEVKPFIILISSMDDLREFGVEIDGKSQELLMRLWPGAVTVILSVSEQERERVAYLHRGTNSLAFRMPAKDTLLELLRITGPVVAPSANPQGQPPATTIAEARKYFGTTVDSYQDGGIVQGEPSTIISIEGEQVTVVRQGSVHLDKM